MKDLFIIRLTKFSFLINHSLIIITITIPTTIPTTITITTTIAATITTITVPTATTTTTATFFNLLIADVIFSHVLSIL